MAEVFLVCTASRPNFVADRPISPLIDVHLALARNYEGGFRISPYLRRISVIWDFGTRNTKKIRKPTCVPQCLVLTTHLPLAYLGVLYSLPACVPRCFILTTSTYWGSAVPMEAWARAYMLHGAGLKLSPKPISQILNNRMELLGFTYSKSADNNDDNRLR